MNEPYSLSVKGAAQYFGFAPKTIYNMISDGKLIRGHHYLKVGGKVVIKRKEFIEWMESEDNLQGR
jgi:excisionase family DNA binding protein